MDPQGRGGGTCYKGEVVGTIVSLAPPTHNTDPLIPAILSPFRYCTVVSKYIPIVSYHGRTLSFIKDDPKTTTILSRTHLARHIAFTQYFIMSAGHLVLNNKSLISGFGSDFSPFCCPLMRITGITETTISIQVKNP